MSVTPYMSLTLPDVSSTPGPTWASELNTALTLIDLHTHESGSGIPITPAGMNINADFTLNSHNLTTIYSAKFNSQSTTLASSYIRSVYSVSGDLYWNNGSGTAVQLTSGSSIVGTTGSITGLSSPASASYNASTNTFSFVSAASTPAKFDIGPLTLSRNVSGGASVTISPSASQSSNYNLTLLDALPGATALLSISNAGVMGTIALPVPVASGGTNATSYTAGSVLFAGASGTSVAQDNTNLFWDDTNNRLGIGINSPSTILHVKGSSSAIFESTSASSAIRFVDTGTANSPQVGSSGDSFVVRTGASATTRLTITSAGAVTIPGDLTLSGVSGAGAVIASSGGLLSTETTLNPARGGLGISSYTAGDLVYASAATTFTKLAIGAASTVLVTNGSVPSWAQITSANIASGTIVNSNISASAGIQAGKLAVNTYATNSSSGSFSVTSTSYGAIDGGSATISTAGRPVLVQLIPAATDGTSAIEVSEPAAGASVAVASGFIRVLRDASVVAVFKMGCEVTDGGTGQIASKVQFPPGVINFVDTPASGSRSWTIEGKVSTAGVTMSVTNIQIMVTEL